MLQEYRKIGATKNNERNCNTGHPVCVLRADQKNKNTMNDLVKILMPISIMGTFGAALVAFTRVLTDYILKKRMIDKGFVNEDTQAIFKQQTIPNFTESRYPSLKWGLIIFFAGLSLILMEYIPHDVESPLPYGLFTLSVSLGFLIYYFIVRKDQK
jgi:hypothetical protein